MQSREGRYEVVKDLLIDLKSLKDELAFAAKLERSIPPEVRSGAGPSGAAGPAVLTERVEPGPDLKRRVHRHGNQAPQARRRARTDGARDGNRRLRLFLFSSRPAVD